MKIIKKNLLKENKTGKKAIYKTEFDIKINKDSLLVTFNAFSSSLSSYSNIYNNDLYKGDVVELFLVTTKDKNTYYEIEVAPNGTNYLAIINNKNGELEHTYIKDNFLKTSVKTNRNNYQVEILIPLDKLNMTSINDFYFNAFRIETDGKYPEKHLFALNPTLCGSFHKTEYFLRLI